MDQYLYPFYRRDVELESSLDRSTPLNCCWLLAETAGSEQNPFRLPIRKPRRAGPLYQNVTIGGQRTRSTASRWMPSTRFLLRDSGSCGRLRSTPAKPEAMRYHAGMSNDFLDACVQVIRCGFGMPAFNNDEIVIPEFIKLGIEPQDAYDYAAIGCIKTAVGGKWGYRCTGMSFINFARVMLAALEGGRDAASGKVCLPQEKALSAGNFNNFDEVMDAGYANPLLHA